MLLPATGAVVEYYLPNTASDPRGITTGPDGNLWFAEFGGDRVAKVEVTFLPGQAPSGEFEEPSELLAADKAEFGTSRIRRWFGREWSAH